MDVQQLQIHDMHIRASHVQTIQVLDEKGNVSTADLLPQLSDDQLREMMHRMVYTRIWDQRALILNRQGKLGFYAPVSGQEGTMIASQYALQSEDMIFPSYRDLPQAVWHGLPLYQAFLYSRGHQGGGKIPEGVHVFMPQIIIGAQIIQATGAALGFKKKGEDRVAVSYIGDGGTSQGDFYEGLNFAGVFNVPAVFVIQNNQYAISVPVEEQSKASSLAQKCVAAGIPGYQVDGMDPLAVYAVMQHCVEHARAGEGPAVIECLTYRFGPHTMAGDDPTRYRTTEESGKWEQNDPLIRLRTFLKNRNLWTEDDEVQTMEMAKKDVQEALRQAESEQKMTIPDLIDTMYELLPRQLEEQKEMYARQQSQSSSVSARKGSDRDA